MIILAVFLLSFFISVKSSNTTHDAGTFHQITKRNAEVAGLSVVLTNDAEHESQLTRHRRSVIRLHDNTKCYKRFFIGGLPPIGFQSSTGLANNVRYICQKYGTTWCFSTMFDLNYGIPIYAAYLVQQGQAFNFGSASRSGLKFRFEPGIPRNRQGSAAMYSNQGTLPCIHKGHLVPAQIYSFSDARIRSTFTYTNAVPQYATFNSGQWSKYERRIRDYAENHCSKQTADLYLLTGISKRRIKFEPGTITSRVKPLHRMPEQPRIVIPNSMWTAGCCVSVSGQNVLGSFAVIGNNHPDKQEIAMSKVTVRSLTILLDVTDLFPGKPGCSQDTNDVDI